MSKLPAIQWYPGDWKKDPGIQALDYHHRGVWWEIIQMMHESERRGVLLLNGKAMPDEALAHALGLPVDLLKQNLTTLLTYGVTSREPATGALMCRRMVRDENLRKIRKNCGKLGGNPNLVNQKSTTQDNQTETPSSSVASSPSGVQANTNQPGRYPTLEEAKTFGARIGCLPAEAERFWNHFEASGWIDKNGNPIVRWQNKLTTWNADSRAKPLEDAHHQVNGAKRLPSINDLRQQREAAERGAAAIKAAHCVDVAMGESWNDQEKRKEYIRLRKQAKTLNDRIIKYELPG